MNDESEKIPLPAEEEIFKTGSNFVNFVHLYIVIGNFISHDIIYNFFVYKNILPNTIFIIYLALKL